MTWLNSTVKRLIVIRALRSIGQGAMVVDLTLYLRSLHWSATAIGGTTSGAGLFGALLILVVGIVSDRIGRKPFLLIYEALTFVAALLACFSTQGLVLVLAIVLAGFGRGQSGAAGPFSPAEQAWLAQQVERADRGRIFSLNNAVGFIGMAAGSLIGGVPTWIHASRPIVSYRPVFALVAGMAVIVAVILSGMREKRGAEAAPTAGSGELMESSTELPAHGGEFSVGLRGLVHRAPRFDQEPAGGAASESVVRRRENREMAKLFFVNSLNGIAVGLTGPMMAYWFSVRYGVSAAAVGTTLGIGFLCTGAASIVSGWMAGRFGMVRSVTWMRMAGSLMMLSLPFIPSYGVASVVYVVRSAVNRGTQGNRSALSTSLTRDSRRGFAVSINALSMRLPSAIGPTVTGYLFDSGALGLPLILTGSLQMVNAALYQWLFRKYDRPPASDSALTGRRTDHS